MSKYFSAEKVKYAFYTVTHPMDGYYWIRHSDKGSVPLALLFVLLFSASFSLNRFYADFVVNDLDPRSVDSLYELAGVFAFYMLLCIGNWSITCLMNGEGRLKDIMIAIGYGTIPITIVILIATALSKVIADNEEELYTLLLVVGIVYGVIVMLVGIMQVHNYSLGKTLATLLLTIIALLIIVFLLLLLSNLLGMVFNFFRSVYTEIIFRI